MIDTIKFLIPFRDSQLVDEVKQNLVRFRKEDLKTGKVEFEFHSSNVRLGSHKRTVSIKSTEIPLGFFVEFSVPKYKKGNNVEMLCPEDIPDAIEILRDELYLYLKCNLPPVSSWIIYRLDICYNWILKDESEALLAIDFIKRIEYPRKQKYVWNTSVMYKGTAYTIKFYHKGSEFNAHDAKELTFETSAQLHPWANRILRFEVGMKRVGLQAYFLQKNVYLSDVASTEKITEALNYYLKDKVFKYLTLKTINNAEIKRILYEHHTKQMATKLYRFHKDYYSEDSDVRDMLVRDGINRSTIYRYKVELKRLGIGISNDNVPLQKGILEKLIIPSPDSRFNLLDQK